MITHLLWINVDCDVLQVGLLLLGVAPEVQHLLQVAEERHLACHTTTLPGHFALWSLLLPTMVTSHMFWPDPPKPASPQVGCHIAPSLSLHITAAKVGAKCALLPFSAPYEGDKGV